MNGSDQYKVKWSTRFKKDYKLAMKRGYNIDLLDEVIRLIAKGDQQQKLIEDYDDHELGVFIFVSFLVVCALQLVRANMPARRVRTLAFILCV